MTKCLRQAWNKLEPSKHCFFHLFNLITLWKMSPTLTPLIRYGIEIMEMLSSDFLKWVVQVYYLMWKQCNVL
jgi:hypothetical protein